MAERPESDIQAGFLYPLHGGSEHHVVVLVDEGPVILRRYSPSPTVTELAVHLAARLSPPRTTMFSETVTIRIV
jgi:hypothetical protein